MLILGCGNVSGFSDRWDFAFENRALSLLMQIRRRKPLLKKLRRLARDESVELWSMDECHFQQHGSRCIMWVPPEEKDPALLHAPTRKSIALFGAVNLYDGQLVTQFSSKFDAITFQDFLKRLLRHRPRNRRIVVILDNARYHHATLLKPLLSEKRHVLSLSFLPPYSPELNPVERVWKLARRLCTHNRYFPQLSDLISAVTVQLDLWNRPNNTLLRLCGIT
jgi:transposase